VVDDVERENEIEAAQIRGHLAGEKEAFRGVTDKARAAAEIELSAASMPT